MGDDLLKIISESIIDMLRDKYPLAKKAYLRLETKERIKALSSATDMRDVLDHLYRAVTISSSEVENKEQLVASEITSANEHLRRAAIEPLETAIEDLVAKIVEKAKYNYILRACGISKVSNEEITGHLEEARDTLYDIRMKKGQMDQFKSMIELMEKQQENLRILDKNLPTKITTKIPFYVIVAFCLGLIIGFIF